MSFDFDTSTGGEGGPWVSWKSQGSDDGNVPKKRFAIKGDEGNRHCTEMESGVVLDLDSIKQGWAKSTSTSVEKSWTKDRPDDSRGELGGFSWRRAFSARIALGKGETATWEDFSAGGYEGFRRLMVAIKDADRPAGKMPLVKVTGATAGEGGKRPYFVPTLEIAKWVEAPAVFSQDESDGFDAEPESAATPEPAASSDDW